MSKLGFSEESPFLDEELMAPPDREVEHDLGGLDSPFLSAELLGRRDPSDRELRAASEVGDASGRLVTFTARTLPVKTTVLVTQGARRARQVDLLFFAHGLDVCRPVFRDRPETFVTKPPFQLGEVVEAAARPLVLVVPFLDWEHLAQNRMSFGRRWHRIAQPANLNGVLAEALERAAELTGASAPPALRNLIVTGHSRAYGVFDALARAHADAEMSRGALGRLSQVWALDSTYSSPIDDWEAWLRSRDDFTATVIYRVGKYRPKNSDELVPISTGVHGSRFGSLAAKFRGQLRVVPVASHAVGHCGIPGAYLPDLLKALPAASAQELAGEQFAVDGESEEEDARREVAHKLLVEGGVAGEAAEEEEAEYPYRESEGPESDTEDEDWESPELLAPPEDEEAGEWSLEADECEGPDLEHPAEAEDEAHPHTEYDVAGGDLLESSGLTPAELKAVLITSTLETGRRGGFFGLSGNFDGQGLSFGLVNWTIGTGSLQPLLREYAAEQPEGWTAAFGANAASFLALISQKGKAAEAEQLRFAIEEMNSSTIVKGNRKWSIREPWHTAFKRLSEAPAFRRIQVRHVRDLLDRARYFCELFRLTSERAYTFMFDAVSSHGKWWLTKKFKVGGQKRKILLDERLAALEAKHGKGGIPEEGILLAIADVLAVTSAEKWRDKVRRRKRWFVTGVHPRAEELAGLEPRADVPYTSTHWPAPVAAATRASAPAPTRSSLSDAERSKLIQKAIHQAKTAGRHVDQVALARALEANKTSVDAWFADFVPDATFLGCRIRESGVGSVPGVHRSLLDVLMRAEQRLLDDHRGRSAQQLGRDLGIYDIAGLRPPKRATGGTLPSYHCFGLAVDINSRTNPFVGNKVPEKGAERYEEFLENRSPRMIERAMLLLRGKKFNVETDVPTTDPGTAWDIHHRASEALAEYLSLASDLNGPRLKQLVEGAPGAGRSLDEWKKRIADDRALIRHWDFPNHRDPEKRGYMDLSRELVVALVDAGLKWGGQYTGAPGHKDMMHFDLRTGPIRRP